MYCSTSSVNIVMVDFLTILTIVYYFFASFFCIGSASTGSTKSATMELYTSSYNETMSGGGETLSSISEKSCISNPNNQGSGSQAFPTQAYLMVMIVFGAKIQISLIFFYAMICNIFGAKIHMRYSKNHPILELNFRRKNSIKDYS